MEMSHAGWSPSSTNLLKWSDLRHSNNEERFAIAESVWWNQNDIFDWRSLQRQSDKKEQELSSPFQFDFSQIRFYFFAYESAQHFNCRWRKKSTQFIASFDLHAYFPGANIVGRMAILKAYDSGNKTQTWSGVTRYSKCRTEMVWPNKKNSCRLILNSFITAYNPLYHSRAFKYSAWLSSQACKGGIDQGSGKSDS